MRAVVQRVNEAAVSVGGEVVGAIDQGLLVLVGVTASDTANDAVALATKIVGLRIFADAAGLMNRSIVDIDGGCLIVPQFTLYGSVRKGRRPSFTDAAPPEIASPLVVRFCDEIRSHHVAVESGVFGAHMHVASVNDGPVTMLAEASGGRIL
jgi:D-tyrosyl-tRNA(Tyr) deacylase